MTCFYILNLSFSLSGMVHILSTVIIYCLALLWDNREYEFDLQQQYHVTTQYSHNHSVFLSFSAYICIWYMYMYIYTYVYIYIMYVWRQNNIVSGNDDSLAWWSRLSIFICITYHSRYSIQNDRKDIYIVMLFSLYHPRSLIRNCICVLIITIIETLHITIQIVR